MPHRASQQDRLQRLRQWRTTPPPDLSMTFIKKMFKRDIERPFTQLQHIVPLWQEHIPPQLAQHCRLLSFKRGILKVGLPSSEHLYELDRLLRAGLTAQLTRATRNALRKIQLVHHP